MLRPSFLLALLPALLGCLTVKATAVNVTIDDVDPSIIYSPASSWHASTVPCSDCLQPPTSSAFNQTWHDGMHIIPTADEDDEPKSPGAPDTDGDDPNAGPNFASTFSFTTTTSTASATDSDGDAPGTTATGTTSSGDFDGDSGGSTTIGSAPAPTATDNDGDGSDGKNAARRRHAANSLRLRAARFGERSVKRDGSDPFEVPGGDSDDPGFVDPPVNATFNFNGTAVYLFAIIPLFRPPNNTAPTLMNLTYTLDSQPVGQFVLNASAIPSTTPEFEGGVNVFKSTNLADTQHSLVVNVGPDSVFLFDYAIFTQGNTTSTNANGSSSTSTSPSSSPTSAASQHAAATFAGAALAGILAVMLCISTSLYILPEV